MPWAARSATSSGTSRRARMPPCTAGCSVTTRWPSISAKPVSSSSRITGIPSSASSVRRAAARDELEVEPDELLANAAMPVLS